MPVYDCKRRDSRGRNHSGIMPATDESSLEGKLKSLGLWRTESNLEKPGADTASKAGLSFVQMSGKRRRRELIDFCTLMTFQVRVGIPLVKALEAAAEDCKDDRFREVLNALQAHLESGLQFHDALPR